MKVAILQSNYIPWKGYFDIIRHVDHFIFYDEVQFTKNDWRNRNLIKAPNGSQWLTIPVGQNIHRKISEVDLPNSSWQIKHLKSLQQNYSRAPHFKTCMTLLEKIYTTTTWQSLSEVNQSAIQWIANDFLGVPTKFSDSSLFAGKGDRNLRLVNILKAVGATSYLTGPAGLAYLDINLFLKHRIEVKVMQYNQYPEYPQLHPPFDHRVSILDMLFMTGKDAAQYFDSSAPSPLASAVSLS
jgi:hypothetical protein